MLDAYNRVPSSRVLFSVSGALDHILALIIGHHIRIAAMVILNIMTWQIRSIVHDLVFYTPPLQPHILLPLAVRHPPPHHELSHFILS